MACPRSQQLSEWPRAGSEIQRGWLQNGILLYAAPIQDKSSERMEVILHNLNDKNGNKAELTASCKARSSSDSGSSYISVLPLGIQSSRGINTSSCTYMCERVCGRSRSQWYHNRKGISIAFKGSLVPTEDLQWQSAFIENLRRTNIFFLSLHIRYFWMVLSISIFDMSVPNVKLAYIRKHKTVWGTEFSIIIIISGNGHGLSNTICCVGF